MMRSSNAGARNPASCQGYNAGSTTTQFQSGATTSRAFGSRLKPFKAPWDTKNLYWSPAFNPGRKPDQYPFASFTSAKASSSVRQALNGPDTCTAVARGAQARNVQPPATVVAPIGVSGPTRVWSAGIADPVLVV